ncbi:unnamed protein product [Acanthoscelides obtectus]|uniref:Uncharacterized protein n=1 Tax=Acanthoscelides obtectus TaxID=200917 RepID=A0A9P0KLE2_ACAOB|nr:unnamed protein product [Acanthoscelides obtectus]CAK1655836.1 Protocadherin-like wing polarity protein stan [Acanthoscelides obtectus]
MKVASCSKFIYVIGYKEHYLCDTEVNLCYSSPCHNHGTCEVREGGYTCLCPEGYLGEQCETVLKKEQDACRQNAPCLFDKDSTKTCLPKPGRPNFICEECSILTDDGHYTPFCELKTRSFVKGAFLTYPSLKQRHRLTVSIKFATQAQSGLLLYNGRYNERHDFLALEIWESDVRFSFSLGDEQVARAQAHIPGGVSDGKWHTVHITYHNRTATVSLDDCDIR